MIHSPPHREEYYARAVYISNMLKAYYFILGSSPKIK